MTDHQRNESHPSVRVEVLDVEHTQPERPSPANDPGRSPRSTDAIQTALLTLMSQYALTGCLTVARSIVQQLRALNTHPDVGACNSLLKGTSEALAHDWAVLIHERTRRSPVRPTTKIH